MTRPEKPLWEILCLPASVSLISVQQIGGLRKRFIVGASLLAKRPSHSISELADRPLSRAGSPQRSCVHIHCRGNGGLGFRPDGGSLSKSLRGPAESNQSALAHHSAPRLGSVCRNTDLAPWAAATGHPWPNAANAASCRVAHGSRPAFRQRGLTGRPRTKARRPESRPD